MSKMPYVTRNGITTFISGECINNAHTQCMAEGCMCPKCHFDRSPAEDRMKITESVRMILSEYPAARKSYSLCQFLYVTRILGVEISFKTWNDLSRVKFESINRTVRHIRGQFPDLRPPEKTR